MKKVFFALLTLSVFGAGILVWLIRSSPSSLNLTKTENVGGLHIVDEKHEEAGKVQDGEDEKEEDEAKGETVAKDAAAAEKGAEEKAPASEEKSSEEKAPATDGASGASLTVKSEPASAKVWVDGKLRGVTPVEIPLGAKSQMVQIEADGYEDFTRSAPAASEAGNGPLTWKVQLRKKSRSAGHITAEEAVSDAPAVPVEAAPTPPAAVEKAAPRAKRKKPRAAVATRGYLIQLKSVPREDGSEGDVAAKKLVEKFQDDLKAVVSNDKIWGCTVDLGAKGKWIRVLVGPFSSKALAAERAVEYKKFSADAFVSRGQKCLP